MVFKVSRVWYVFGPRRVQVLFKDWLKNLVDGTGETADITQNKQESNYLQTYLKLAELGTLSSPLFTSPG